MAIHKLEGVKINGSNKLFGGYIYNISYSPSLGDKPSELIVNVISENGSYTIDTDDLQVTTPYAIAIGQNLSLSMYPISYSKQNSTGQKTLEIKFWDTSIILDKIWIGLRYNSAISTDPMMIVLGTPKWDIPMYAAQIFEDMTASDITLRKELDIPERVYNILDIINGIRSKGIQFDGVGAVIDGIDLAQFKDFYIQQSGTVRSILFQTLNDIGLTFYWENDKIHIMDLRNGISKQALIDFLISKNIDSLCKNSLNEDATIENTVDRKGLFYISRQGELIGWSNEMRTGYNFRIMDPSEFGYPDPGLDQQDKENLINFIIANAMMSAGIGANGEIVAILASDGSDTSEINVAMHQVANDTDTEGIFFDCDFGDDYNDKAYADYYTRLGQVGVRIGRIENKLEQVGAIFCDADEAISQTCLAKYFHPNYADVLIGSQFGTQNGVWVLLEPHAFWKYKGNNYSSIGDLISGVSGAQKLFSGWLSIVDFLGTKGGILSSLNVQGGSSPNNNTYFMQGGKFTLADAKGDFLDFLNEIELPVEDSRSLIKYVISEQSGTYKVPRVETIEEFVDGQNTQNTVKIDVNVKGTSSKYDPNNAESKQKYFNSIADQREICKKFTFSITEPSFNKSYSFNFIDIPSYRPSIGEYLISMNINMSDRGIESRYVFGTRERKIESLDYWDQQYMKNRYTGDTKQNQLWPRLNSPPRSQ